MPDGQGVNVPTARNVFKCFDEDAEIDLIGFACRKLQIHKPLPQHFSGIDGVQGTSGADDTY